MYNYQIWLEGKIIHTSKLAPRKKEQDFPRVLSTVKENEKFNGGIADSKRGWLNDIRNKIGVQN